LMFLTEIESPVADVVVFFFFSVFLGL